MNVSKRTFRYIYCLGEDENRYNDFSLGVSVIHTFPYFLLLIFIRNSTHITHVTVNKYWSSFRQMLLTTIRVIACNGRSDNGRDDYC